MGPALNCERCEKTMQVEMRVASLSTRGVFRSFFSCACGHVDATSCQQDEEEVVIERLPKWFLAWATKKRNWPAGRHGK
jgi:hypothetical protein